MALIPLGLDCQNRHCPWEFDRRLWHRGGTLDVSSENLKEIRYKFDVSSENLKEIRYKFEGTPRGF